MILAIWASRKKNVLEKIADGKKRWAITLNIYNLAVGNWKPYLRKLVYSDIYSLPFSL